jgi:hypothetical protein
MSTITRWAQPAHQALLQEGVVRQPPRPQQKKLPSLPIDALNEPVLVTIDGECRKNVGDRRESGAREAGPSMPMSISERSPAGSCTVISARVNRYLAALRAAASRSG